MPPETHWRDRIIDSLIDHRFDLFTVAELRLLDRALPVERQTSKLREEVTWNLLARGEQVR